ncbi:hypothetical protein [Streptomyces asoensis]|nr:hypothetical protein [Streptomyces asoensis]
MSAAELAIHQIRVGTEFQRPGRQRRKDLGQLGDIGAEVCQ